MENQYTFPILFFFFLSFHSPHTALGSPFTSTSYFKLFGAESVYSSYKCALSFCSLFLSSAIYYLCPHSIFSPIKWASLIAQLVKKLPAMQENWVRSLCWVDPLEKGKATHSSILAWRIPWTVCIVHGVRKNPT